MAGSSPSSRTGEGRHSVAVLEQRVYGLEVGQKDLAADISQLGRALGDQIAALSSTVQERQRPPWQALGVMLTAFLAIGGLVYYPIREGQARLETVLDKLADRVVTKSEAATSGQRRDDWQRVAEKQFDRIDRDTDAMQKAIVPRGEHEEKWRSADQRFLDQQRQIDDLKRFNTDLVSAKDFLRNLDERVRLVERSRLSPGS